MKRCPWAEFNEREAHYHDTEWGVPVHDDRLLFELLILEGAQAGLSWATVLKKREGYQKAFDFFDVQKVAGYTEEKKEMLRMDTGIIRNKLKINAAVTNARAFIAIQKEYGYFSTYLWSFVKGQPLKNAWQRKEDVPVSTPESDRMSQELKRAGFKYVGTTICYAYMQAIGMVNDHLVSCTRYHEV